MPEACELNASSFHLIVQTDFDIIVTSEEARRYTAIIDEILGSSDLNLISAKAIRKGLQEKVEDDINAKKVWSNTQLYGSTR